MSDVLSVVSQIKTMSLICDTKFQSILLLINLYSSIRIELEILFK